MPSRVHFRDNWKHCMTFSCSFRGILSAYASRSPSLIFRNLVQEFLLEFLLEIIQGVLFSDSAAVLSVDFSRSSLWRFIQELGFLQENLLLITKEVPSGSSSRNSFQDFLQEFFFFKDHSRNSYSISFKGFLLAKPLEGIPVGISKEKSKKNILGKPQTEILKETLKRTSGGT